MTMRMKKLGLVGAALMAGSWLTDLIYPAFSWLHWLNTATGVTFLCGSADMLVFLTLNISALLRDFPLRVTADEECIRVFRIESEHSAECARHAAAPRTYRGTGGVRVTFHDERFYPSGPFGPASMRMLPLIENSTTFVAFGEPWPHNSPSRYVIHERRQYMNGRLYRTEVCRFDRLAGTDDVLSVDAFPLPQPHMVYHRTQEEVVEGVRMTTELKAVINYPGRPCDHCGDIHFPDDLEADTAWQ